MKKIDIINKIKNESKEFTPNPIDKIKTLAQANNLLPREQENNYVCQNNGVAVKIKSKYYIFGFIATCIIAIICIALILTFTLKPNVNPLQPSLSTKEIYGMGAVSTVKLLDSNLSINALTMLSSYTYSEDEDRTNDKQGVDLVKKNAKYFNNYFTAFDSFFGDDIVSIKTTDNTELQYNYNSKMEIIGENIDGSKIIYTMYYAEELIEIESDGGKEQRFELTGIIKMGTKDYYVEGERSIESEKNEIESDLKIRAYANKNDRNTYVQMEQEFSEEKNEVENEYIYSIYKDGHLIESTSVKFETQRKNNKIETEYELEFKSGNALGKYVVEQKIVDKNAKIKVEYKIDDIEGEFFIREVKFENKRKYEYTFLDDSILLFDKVS